RHALSKLKGFHWHYFLENPSCIRILSTLLLWRAHAKDIFATLTKIDFAGRGSVIFWTPPFHHVFRVSPRFPDQLDWSINDPSNDKIFFLFISTLSCIL